MAAIRAGGHIIGNHGYSHRDGFKTGLQEYLDDADRAAQFTSSFLFRPPYGRLKPLQYIEIRKKYRIFLWDIMPYDFDKTLSPEKSLAILKKKIRPGSLIVFHDTCHSSATEILGKFIASAISEGYGFDIPPEAKQPC